MKSLRPPSLLSARFLAAVALAWLTSCCSAGQTGTPGGGWQDVYLGTDPRVPFFPDGNANYWAYHLERGWRGSNIGLRIEGRFPKVHYMSFTVYDDKTFSSVAHLTDFQIRPGGAGINPFAPPPGAQRPVGGYRILIIPRGSPHAAEANVIEYDPALRAVSVFLRYYSPRGSATGGVPLPQITAFDLTTGRIVQPRVPRIVRIQHGRIREELLSRFLDKYVARKLNPLFSVASPDRALSAFRADSQGLYANADNKYLVVPIVKRSDQVAVLRFKPPTEAGRHGRGADVRYWSISLGDDKSHNIETLADEQVKLDADGYATIVLAEPSPQVVQKARAFNFIPWRLGNRGVLIYRNLITRRDFAGDFDRIPEFSETAAWSQLTGRRFIGAYAPGGRLMSVDEFLKLKRPQKRLIQRARQPMSPTD